MIDNEPIEDQIVGGVMRCAAERNEVTVEYINILLAKFTFRIESNQIVFAAICEMVASSSAVDLVSIASYLRSNGQFWAAGGATRLAALWINALSIDELDELIKFLVN